MQFRQLGHALGEIRGLFYCKCQIYSYLCSRNQHIISYLSFLPGKYFHERNIDISPA
nr:MAG TPA: hypothetical protein [Caudoviricetes sp.]